MLDVLIEALQAAKARAESERGSVLPSLVPVFAVFAVFSLLVFAVAA